MKEHHTTEMLLKRKKIAKKATQGVWIGYFNDPDHYNGCINCGNKHVALCNVYDIPGNPRRVTPKKQKANTAFIAANSPKVVINDIEEIIELRDRVQQNTKEISHLKDLLEQDDDYIANLELDAKRTDKRIGEIAKILGIEHDTGDTSTLNKIKNKIIQLLKTNEQ